MSQVSHLPKHAQEVFSGDLIVPKGFKWALESKDGCLGIDINSVFVGGNKELDAFLEQAKNDASRCGRKPMLCWKWDRKPWLVAIPTVELAAFSWLYSFSYWGWSIVSLTGLPHEKRARS